MLRGFCLDLCTKMMKLDSAKFAANFSPLSTAEAKHLKWKFSSKTFHLKLKLIKMINQFYTFSKLELKGKTCFDTSCTGVERTMFGKRKKLESDERESG